MGNDLLNNIFLEYLMIAKCTYIIIGKNSLTLTDINRLLTIKKFRVQYNSVSFNTF